MSYTVPNLNEQKPTETLPRPVVEGKKPQAKTSQLGVFATCGVQFNSKLGNNNPPPPPAAGAAGLAC